MRSLAQRRWCGCDTPPVYTRVYLQVEKYALMATGYEIASFGLKDHSQRCLEARPAAEELSDAARIVELLREHRSTEHQRELESGTARPVSISSPTALSDLPESPRLEEYKMSTTKVPWQLCSSITV